jgi:hypothetical protein
LQSGVKVIALQDFNTQALAERISRLAAEAWAGGAALHEVALSRELGVSAILAKEYLLVGCELMHDILRILYF